MWCNNNKTLHNSILFYHHFFNVVQMPIVSELGKLFNVLTDALWFKHRFLWLRSVRVLCPVPSRIDDTVPFCWRCTTVRFTNHFNWNICFGVINPIPGDPSVAHLERVFHIDDRTLPGIHSTRPRQVKISLEN